MLFELSSITDYWKHRSLFIRNSSIVSERWNSIPIFAIDFTIVNHWAFNSSSIQRKSCPNSTPTVCNEIFKSHRWENESESIVFIQTFSSRQDQTSIRDFLEYDKHFRHADKVKRIVFPDSISVTPILVSVLVGNDVDLFPSSKITWTSFYQRFVLFGFVSFQWIYFDLNKIFCRWLAHDSVEEDLTAKYGLLPWALQTHDDHPSVDLKNDFKRFLTKKNDLWTRMAFRARVTKDECEQVNRWRKSFLWYFLTFVSIERSDHFDSAKSLDLATWKKRKLLLEILEKSKLFIFIDGLAQRWHEVNVKQEKKAKTSDCLSQSFVFHEYLFSSSFINLSVRAPGQWWSLIEMPMTPTR